MPGPDAPHGTPGGRPHNGTLWRTTSGFEQLAGGLRTAVSAMVLSAVLAASWILCVVGIGFLLLPRCLDAIRPLADRERTRLTRWGAPVAVPAAAVPAARDHLVDPTARRELAWLVVHGTIDLLLAALGLLLPVIGLGALSFPLWWRTLANATLPQWVTSAGLTDLATWAGWTVSGWSGAFGVAALGLLLIVITVVGLPALAWLQGACGRELLSPPDEGDMSIRVAQLTATRAAALDAHAIELRRIERALHDGTQNRLVAVNVLLGTVRRAVQRDPSTALEAIDRAQTATESALADLRSVARTILPPVLTDRGLPAALDGLAANSPVPCNLTIDLPIRCAAATEATAYFAVAEALTNSARHSHATQVSVVIRSDIERLVVTMEDNGQGGADDRSGTGLLGIRQRTEALDGTMTLSSPPGGPSLLKVDLPCGS